MLSGDFFAFCTALKPLELKAIGQLSEVRHLPGGRTIYRPGDMSDMLFIINRGMVEVVQGSGSAATPRTYLSRGDIFGDVELLTNLPRKHLVRACESVSLQCFHARDLPELLRRVPCFFRYLCEQFASRLLQASDLALARSHCLELSGSLANFDLVTILQTIVNSSRTGDLSILDEQNQLVGGFYFESGRLRGAQYQHLLGEEAFWQLFLEEEVPGTFSFSSSERRTTAAAESEDIVRAFDDMLITALQTRDEFSALRSELPDSSAALVCQKDALRLDGISAAFHGTAEQIWRLSRRGGRLRLRSLFPHLNVCEFRIYQAVKELVQTEHFSLSEAPAAKKVVQPA